MIPGLPDDPRVIDSTGALSPGSIPKRLLVIGGGIIGLEMACVYDALGSRVTVVEMLDQLMTGCDRDLVRPLQPSASARATRRSTPAPGSARSRRRRTGSRSRSKASAAQLFDRVLVAVGRTPNGRAARTPMRSGSTWTSAGSSPWTRRCAPTSPACSRSATSPAARCSRTRPRTRATLAAEVIAGHDVVFDARGDPVGRLHRPRGRVDGSDRDRGQGQPGVPFEKAVFPWAASGRALALGRDEGMTKLLFEPGTAPGARRRDRRGQRGRSDRRDGAGDRARRRRRGPRPDDPSAPDAVGDGRLRRADGRGHDHGPDRSLSPAAISRLRSACSPARSCWMRR